MPTLNQPVFQFHPNHELLILNEDYSIVFVYDKWLFEITGRKGFVFDGASIPQAVWSLVGSPFIGAHRIGALVHDLLYKCAPREGTIIDRELSDDIFKFLMDQFGASEFIENVFYKSVDIFGGSSWDDGTKLIEESNFSRFLSLRITEV